MAQYSTNFSEYTAGQEPSDWTHQWSTAISYTAETGSGLGGKLLQQAHTAEGVGGLSWDDAGSAADVEILAKVRLHSDTSTIDYGAGLHLRGSGASGSANAYHVSLDLGGQQVNIGRNVAGSYASIVSSVAFTFTYDQWVWIRFRVNGTAIKVRWWLDGNSEPGTWNVETTNSDVTGAGTTGVYTYDGIDDQYDFFSVDNDGGTAPSPSSGWDNKIHGIVPAKVNGVAVANIASINGV